MTKTELREESAKVVRRWIEKGDHFKVFDPITVDGPCQIFKTSFKGRTETRFRTQGAEAIRRHMHALIWTLAMGVASDGVDHEGRSTRTLYGFKERVGRLPGPGDDCCLGYLGKHPINVRRYEQSPYTDDIEGAVTSEVCLHVNKTVEDDDEGLLSKYLWEPAVNMVNKAFADLIDMDHNPFVPGS